MKKFSRITESSESFFIVEATVKMKIKAGNEGEASYIADSSLSAIKDQFDFTISKVESNSI